MKNKYETKYNVIRDNQEKVGYWDFCDYDYCQGMITDQHMDTGDYCIEGMEKIFTVERKKTTGELSGNISQPRFERELARMDKLKHSFLILEFTLDDVYNFPVGSGIPSKKWNELRVTSNYILKRLLEIETSHKVKIIFAGNKGEQMANVVFKRMIEMYG